MFDDVDNEEIKGIKGLIQNEKDYYLDMLPRGYLSVSQVAQYLKCGEAYRRKYVLEEPTPKNSYLVQGSGVHLAAEALHLSIIDGTPISPDDMADVYAGYHEENIHDAEINEEEEGTAGQVKDIGVLLSKKYHEGAMGRAPKEKSGAPYDKVIPVAAERIVKTKLKTDKFEEVPFLAVIDLEESTAVADLKVKKKAASDHDVANNLQLSLYSHITGKPTVRLDQLVRPTKTLPARYRRNEAVKNKAETLHAVDIVAEVASDIAAGRFRRTNPENWWCGEKWCPYWSKCRGRKR
jgi:hypothetical protein